MNLKGKTIIITGGTLGIGLAGAKAFKALGARVAITGRSAHSQKLASKLGFDFYTVDYGSLASVKKLANSLLQNYPQIDVLANNVGGIMNERTLSSDGHEMTFQVNHLAGFYLTLLLKDRMERSGTTIINTASLAHRFGKVKLDDLENAHKYNPNRAYGTAKLMNILHAKEINRRFNNVSAVSFHPGPVATGFARAGGWFVKLIYETPLKSIFLISPKKGADTLVWLAGERDCKGWHPGGYYAKRKLAKAAAQASDVRLSQGLWDACAMLCESSDVTLGPEAQN